MSGMKKLIVGLAYASIALTQVAYADIVTLKCTRTDDSSNTIKVLIDLRKLKVKPHLSDWEDILYADDKTVLWKDYGSLGDVTYLLDRSSLHLQVTSEFNDLVHVQNRKCVRPL
jgi:hypothetical protein